jgi:hypothetical protein
VDAAVSPPPAGADVVDPALEDAGGEATDVGGGETGADPLPPLPFDAGGGCTGDGDTDVEELPLPPPPVEVMAGDVAGPLPALGAGPVGVGPPWKTVGVVDEPPTV